MAYATLAQFELFGLRRDVITPRSRALAVVDPTTNTLGVASSHGWGGSEALQFVAGPMAGVTPALPAGLSTSVVYRPLPVDGSDSLFQVALTVGGSAVDFTDAGAGALQIVEQLGTMISAGLELWSGILDEDLVSYEGPIAAPVPPVLTWCVCKLYAYDLAVTQALVTSAYWEQSRETIAKQADEANKLRALWRAGKLLERIVADATPDVVENGAQSFGTVGPWDSWIGGAC